MEYIEIKLKYRNYKAHLILENKITVIMGLSATGKSTIHKILSVRDWNKTIEVSNKQYNLIYLNNIDTLKMYTNSGTFNRYNIYVIDEGNIEIDNEVSTLIRDSTYVYFIITSRTSLRSLNFSLDSVKQLKTDDRGIIRLENLIKFIEQPDSKLRLNKINHCIVEDSGKAFEWFRDLFSNTNINLDEPAGGKEQVCSKIDNILNDENYVLAIFDECSFGSCIKELKAIIDKYSNRVTILSNYKSWEFLILKSNFYKHKMIPYDLSIGKFEEAYYEDLLYRISNESGKYTVINHNSNSPLSKCYTEPCCAFAGRNDKRCNIGLKSGDKFRAMLLGTEFEKLLIIANREGDIE